MDDADGLIRLVCDAVDPGARASAAEALGQVTGDTAAAGEALLGALNDSDDLVRAEAADALGRLRYRLAGAALAVLLAGDRSPVVRASAAESLGDIGDPAHLGPVVAAARHDEDEAVRAYSAATLGLLGAEDETLRSLHTDELSTWVRTELSLARYRRGAIPLSAALAPLDTADRELAERLLNALDDLASRPRRHVTATDANTVMTVLSRLADRIPELQTHTRSVIRTWHHDDR